MPSIDVRIVRAGERAPWPELDTAEIQHITEPLALAAVEQGMASGKTSVAIKVPMPDGSVVVAETSLAVWIAATCALRGAFPAEFAGTPLAGSLG